MTAKHQLLLLPPWQRRLRFWWRGLSVWLLVDITQKVMNGLALLQVSFSQMQNDFFVSEHLGNRGQIQL